AQSALAGKSMPKTASFDVIGMGIQSSTSSSKPYAFNGYMMLPRGTSDIIPDTSGSVGNAELPSAISFNIYPNPFTSELFLDVTNAGNSNAQIMISDLAGRILSSEEKPISAGQQLHLRVPPLQKGIYFIHIRIGENSYVRKLVHD